MKHMPEKTDKPKPGRLYFSKAAERRVFFFMTLAMLGAGLLARMI